MIGLGAEAHVMCYGLAERQNERVKRGGMTSELEAVRAALAETEHLFDSVTHKGFTPPVWFIEYRVQLRLLLARPGRPLPERPEQLDALISPRQIH